MYIQQAGRMQSINHSPEHGKLFILGAPLPYVFRINFFKLIFFNTSLPAPHPSNQLLENRINANPAVTYYYHQLVFCISVLVQQACIACQDFRTRITCNCIVNQPFWPLQPVVCHLMEESEHSSCNYLFVILG